MPQIPHGEPQGPMIEGDSFLLRLILDLEEVVGRGEIQIENVDGGALVEVNPQLGPAPRMSAVLATGAVASLDAVVGVTEEDVIFKELSQETKLSDSPGELGMQLVVDKEPLGGDLDK